MMDCQSRKCFCYDDPHLFLVNSFVIRFLESQERGERREH